MPRCQDIKISFAREAIWSHWLVFPRLPRATQIHDLGTQNHKKSRRSRGVQNIAQSEPQASQIAPQMAQSDFKINEKSTPAPDLRGFGETLFFDDGTMVLLVFSGPDDL